MPIDFRLGLPPDFQFEIPKGQDSIGSFFGAFSAAQNAKGKPNPDGTTSKPGFFSRVSQGYLGAEAEQKAAADPLFEERQRAFDLANQEAQLRVKSGLKEYEDRVSGQSALLGLSNLVSGIVAEGRSNDPESRAELLDYLGKNPTVLGTPEGKGLLMEFNLSRSILSEREKLRLESEQLRLDEKELELRYSPERQPSGALPEIEEIFQQAEKDGMPFSPKAKQEAREIRLGLKSRMGTDSPVISEDEYVSKHLNDFIAVPRKEVVSTGAFGMKDVKKERYTEAEGIDALRKQYRMIYRGISPSKEPSSGVSTTKEVVRVTKDGRKAVFDAETKKFLRYAD